MDSVPVYSGVYPLSVLVLGLECSTDDDCQGAGSSCSSSTADGAVDTWRASIGAACAASSRCGARTALYISRKKGDGVLDALATTGDGDGDEACALGSGSADPTPQFSPQHLNDTLLLDSGCGPASALNGVQRGGWVMTSSHLGVSGPLSWDEVLPLCEATELKIALLVQEHTHLLMMPPNALRAVHLVICTQHVADALCAAEQVDNVGCFGLRDVLVHLGASSGVKWYSGSLPPRVFQPPRLASAVVHEDTSGVLLGCTVALLDQGAELGSAITVSAVAAAISGTAEGSTRHVPELREVLIALRRNLRGGSEAVSVAQRAHLLRSAASWWHFLVQHQLIDLCSAFSIHEEMYTRLAPYVLFGKLQLESVPETLSLCYGVRVCNQDVTDIIDSWGTSSEVASPALSVNTVQEAIVAALQREPAVVDMTAPGPQRARGILSVADVMEAMRLLGLCRVSYGSSGHVSWWTCPPCTGPGGVLDVTCTHAPPQPCDLGQTIEPAVEEERLLVLQDVAADPSQWRVPVDYDKISLQLRVMSVGDCTRKVRQHALAQTLSGPAWSELERVSSHFENRDKSNAIKPLALILVSVLDMSGLLRKLPEFVSVTSYAVEYCSGSELLSPRSLFRESESRTLSPPTSFIGLPVSVIEEVFYTLVHVTSVGILVPNATEGEVVSFSSLRSPPVGLQRILFILELWGICLERTPISGYVVFREEMVCMLRKHVWGARCASEAAARNANQLTLLAQWRALGADSILISTLYAQERVALESLGAVVLSRVRQEILATKTVSSALHVLGQAMKDTDALDADQTQGAKCMWQIHLVPLWRRQSWTPLHVLLSLVRVHSVVIDSAGFLNSVKKPLRSHGSIASGDRLYWQKHAVEACADFVCLTRHDDIWLAQDGFALGQLKHLYALHPEVGAGCGVPFIRIFHLLYFQTATIVFFEPVAGGTSDLGSDVNLCDESRLWKSQFYGDALYEHVMKSLGARLKALRGKADPNGKRKKGKRPKEMRSSQECRAEWDSAQVTTPSEPSEEELALLLDVSALSSPLLALSCLIENAAQLHSYEQDEVDGTKRKGHGGGTGTRVVLLRRNLMGQAIRLAVVQYEPRMDCEANLHLLLDGFALRGVPHEVSREFLGFSTAVPIFQNPFVTLQRLHQNKAVWASTPPERQPVVDIAAALDCTVVTSVDDTFRLISHFMRQPFVSVDSEFTEWGRVGECLRERHLGSGVLSQFGLCLLQIGDPMGNSFVFDALLSDMSGECTRLAVYFLCCSPQVVKVLHAASADLAIIADITGTTPVPFADSQLLHRVLMPTEKSIGFKRLVHECVGSDIISKQEQRSHWHRRPLRPSQVRYALCDVLYLGPVFIRCLSKLVAPDGIAPRLARAHEWHSGLALSNVQRCADRERRGAWKALQTADE